MLNSRNYQSDGQILNSGEEIHTGADEFTDPDAKTYYHTVAGSITHLPDGAQITFQGGQFVTANREIQKFLDKIANKRGSMVYTKKEVAVAPNEEVRHAALAAMVRPGDQGKPEANGMVSDQDVTKTIDPNSLKPSVDGDKTASVLKPGVLREEMHPKTILAADIKNQNNVPANPTESRLQTQLVDQGPGPKSGA